MDAGGLSASGNTPPPEKVAEAPPSKKHKSGSHKGAKLSSRA
eukprot:CAMPEP_0114121968 /NCGR_PEP_ID=MMETSP0043_2-20121206/7451_1 /TAXON_ID=464988 /ORGANISM="Hemiselmis andersenii, Strain CCMP644" /LENGTH=41 /DNA_ID= /DNA_START= /DNA_END= /DNA_ORIENTATION=